MDEVIKLTFDIDDRNRYQLENNGVNKWPSWFVYILLG